MPATPAPAKTWSVSFRENGGPVAELHGLAPADVGAYRALLESEPGFECVSARDEQAALAERYPVGRRVRHATMPDLAGIVLGDGGDGGAPTWWDPFHHRGEVFVEFTGLRPGWFLALYVLPRKDA